MTIAPPQYLQSKAYTARQDRQLIGDGRTAGIVGVNSMAASGSGATRGISITAGVAYVAGTTNANQGMYRVFSDAAKTLVHDVAVTNPRLDQIICRVYDATEVGSGADQATIEILKGTETSGATLVNRNGAAALPASCLLLADVLITTSAGVLSGSDITDKRVGYGLVVDGNFRTTGATVVTAALNNAAQVNIGQSLGAGVAAITFGSAVDTNLYRSAAGVLMTDGHFNTGGDLQIRNSPTDTYAQIILQRNSLGSQQPALLFGPGGSTGGTDTNLYRPAVGVLKTDGGLAVGSGIGRVAGNGTIISGSGFSVSKTGTGLYTITMDTARPSAITPIVQSLQHQRLALEDNGFTATTTVFKVTCQDTTGGTAQDSPFSFMLLGG